MYLYGASGHAKVVIEILELCGEKIEVLFDDNEFIKNILNYPVIKYNEGPGYNGKCIVSIGNNAIRKKIVEKLSLPFTIAIHPITNISKRSTLQSGTVVMGGVSINSDARIGRHCIINTNASVDHDCVINDFVHISPNATLCGYVEIGEGTQVGAGAVIIPGKKIGKWCIIGAGAVVVTDIADYAVVVGNPGRIIKIKSKQ